MCTKHKMISCRSANYCSCATVMASVADACEKYWRLTRPSNSLGRADSLSTSNNILGRLLPSSIVATVLMVQANE